MKFGLAHCLALKIGSLILLFRDYRYIEVLGQAGNHNTFHLGVGLTDKYTGLELQSKFCSFSKG
jgi:hypothetical protein